MFYKHFFLVQYLFCFQGLSTKVYVDKRQVWRIPDHWQLHEAAVVPIAYSTAYFGLIIQGQLCCGNSVLVHGSNCVSHAAIHIAFHHGCDVFITTPSLLNLPELLTKFHQLKKENVLLLSDDFQNNLMRKTKGLGKLL